MGAHIGTSGWSYQHWRGDFYPQGLRPGQWLEHYARTFGTVEVNNTFYRMPRRDVVEGWCARTPPGFLFTYKLWRGFTQYARLVDKRPQLASFMGLLEGCPAPRRGVLLVHLPPQMRHDASRLDRLATFLRDLRQLGAWRVAVEFRHPSWHNRSTRKALDEAGAAICLHDMPESGTDAPNDVGFVYMRRHGPGRYSGSYTMRQVRTDAHRIQEWLGEGRDVFAYFNNDLGGHAPRNAASLMRVLGQVDTGGWGAWGREGRGRQARGRGVRRQKAKAEQPGRSTKGHRAGPRPTVASTPVGNAHGRGAGPVRATAGRGSTNRLERH